jgi:hypothetical protein
MQISLHPLVNLSIFDHYLRGDSKNTFGGLLGIRSEDGLDIEMKNTFPLILTKVKEEEEEEEVEIEGDDVNIKLFYFSLILLTFFTCEAILLILNLLTDIELRIIFRLLEF